MFFSYLVEKIYKLCFFLLGMNNNDDEDADIVNNNCAGEEQPEKAEQKDAKEEILEKAGREYYESAEDDLNKDRYNSAVVLYFKALATFSDLFLLKEMGKSPSSHNERFRITEEKFTDIYDLLDKDFPFYQDSYTKIMSKELAEVIKNDAETVAEKAKVKL